MYLLDTNTVFGGATTQYTNLDFNSMTRFGERHLAASPTGLWLFSGNLDNLSNIPAYFITATMDFGIGRDKHVRWIDISLEATGDLQLIVNTEKVAAQTYIIDVRPELGQQEVRVILSRSLFGRFWTFKVGNSTTGVDFSIDEMKILPVVRTLRR